MNSLFLYWGLTEKKHVPGWERGSGHAAFPAWTRSWDPLPVLTTDGHQKHSIVSQKKAHLAWSFLKGSEILSSQAWSPLEKGVLVCCQLSEECWLSYGFCHGFCIRANTFSEGRPSSRPGALLVKGEDHQLHRLWQVPHTYPYCHLCEEAIWEADLGSQASNSWVPCVQEKLTGTGEAAAGVEKSGCGFPVAVTYFTLCSPALPCETVLSVFCGA